MYGHSNGNVYVVYVKSNNGIPYEDTYICKLNAQWDTVWSRKIGGSYEDILNEIRELPNGNLLLAGYTSSQDGDVWYGHSYSAREIWMVEVDTMGNIIKGKTFGGGHGSELTDVIISSDGYIYLAGNTIANDYDFACVNYGNMDGSAWVAKYDTNFNKIWINMYVGNGDEGWPTIQEINPTRFVVGYETNSTSFESDPGNAKGATDLLALYIDNNGSTIWKKRYGSNYSDGSRKSVVDPITKHIYFVGNIGSGTNFVANGDITHMSGTIWVHKIDTLGNIKGSKAYGANTDLSYTSDVIWYNDELYVFASSDGGGGDMDLPVGTLGGNNTFIGIVDTNVNLVGKKTLSVQGGVYVYNTFIHNNDLHISTYIGTYTNPYKCDTANVVAEVFRIGKAPLKLTEPNTIEINMFEIYPNPNPNGNVLYIEIADNYIYEKGELVVKDIAGKTVYKKKIQRLQTQETIDCSSWSNGNYIIELKINNQKQIQKFTKN